jgi:hypothetical protein
VCAIHANPEVRLDSCVVEAVQHPTHYGGADNPYEAIKVIHAWGLSFTLGCVLKYVCRAGKKYGTDPLVDLRKARFYLDWEIKRREEIAGK